MSADLRKKIEKQIYDTYKLLDPTGLNVTEYKKQYSSMSDAEFFKHMEEFIASDKNFYLIMSPYQVQPKLDDVKKAVEINDGECEEYVYFRDDSSIDANNDSDEFYRSPVKLPVFPIHIRRLEQIVNKKNNYTYSIGKRNSLINQATGEDKVARNSDIESYALLAQGANNTLKELLGPRADSGSAKISMYRKIAEKQHVRLDELAEDITTKATLRLTDVYLTSAGFKTDLLGPGLVLSQTLKDS